MPTAGTFGTDKADPGQGDMVTVDAVQGLAVV